MELLGNHKQLKLAHESIMSNVEDNMKNLHEEKSLIATGNKQIAEMVENIKQKLGTYIVFHLAITVKILWNKQHFFCEKFYFKICDSDPAYTSENLCAMKKTLET